MQQVLFQKIILGRQTGADRAALDFAISRQIPHGGRAKLGGISSCCKGATASGFCTVGAAGSRRPSRQPDLVAAHAHHGDDRLALPRGAARLRLVWSVQQIAHQSLRYWLAWSGGG